MKSLTFSFSLLFFAAIVLGFPAFSNAAIVTYTGQDSGASTAGPWTNSAAAQSAFMTAAGAFGTTNTITFENLPTGYYTPFTAAPGVTVTMTAPNYGLHFSGISNSTLGNLYGFNTTSGGEKWLGFPGGSATFAFSSPTNSFGMYLTGLQTLFTASLTVNFNDGASEVLPLPVTASGGAEYYGFTDTVAISSITITNRSGDAWGIDDVTFTVPEPTTIIIWSLLGALAITVGWRRRKAA
jgi:hypothetical protein